MRTTSKRKIKTAAKPHAAKPNQQHKNNKNIKLAHDGRILQTNNYHSTATFRYTNIYKK